jgi:hypothetical protein
LVSSNIIRVVNAGQRRHAGHVGSQLLL